MKNLLALFLLCIAFSVKAQSPLEKDTAYIRIQKMPDDTNKVIELFETGLYATIKNIELSGFLAQKSYDLAKKLKFSKGITQACDLLATYYKQKGNFKTSYQWLKKTIPIREASNDYFGLAITHYQLANLFRDMDNTKMALVFAHKTLGYSKKLNSSRFIALSYGTIAAVHYKDKALDSSLYYFQQAVLLHTENKDSSSLVIPLSGIGNIYLDKKMYARSIEYHQKALAFLKNQTNYYYELTCWFSLGKAYYESNDLKKAGLALNKCLVYLDKYAEAKQKMEIYKLHSQYLYKTGDFKNAYEFDQKYQAVKDSIEQGEVKKNLNDLETKYQAEKKQKENALLKQKRKIDQLIIADSERRSFILLLILIGSVIVILVVGLFLYNRNKTAKLLASQNDQINKQNNTLKTLNSQLIESEEELQKANEAKGQLLSIISHDISSPIKALYNYEEALLEKAKSFTSMDDFTTAIAKLHKSTGEVYTMSNNLLDYAQTQQEGFVPEITEIKLAELVANILKALEQPVSLKKLRIQHAIEPSVRIKSDQNLLYILLRNIISNAVKFSPEGKTIRIEWENDLHKILIADEGEGMDKQKIQAILEGQNFHSSLGTQGEKGTGLGMKIVLNCAQKLNAKMDIQSELGKGTTFGIQL